MTLTRTLMITHTGILYQRHNSQGTGHLNGRPSGTVRATQGAPHHNSVNAGQISQRLGRGIKGQVHDELGTGQRAAQSRTLAGTEVGTRFKR